jgi:ABC-type dipeptide/oligopeptide/nickel transport system permease subunit
VVCGDQILDRLGEFPRERGAVLRRSKMDFGVEGKGRDLLLGLTCHPHQLGDHLLGTDVNGNDVLSRLIYGGRASLTVGIAVNVIGLVVGGTLGALAPYLGGKADTLIMRGLDVVIAFPSLVLVIVLVIVGSAWIFQRRLIYLPARDRVPPAHEVIQGARDVTLQTRDGLAQVAPREAGMDGREHPW